MGIDFTWSQSSSCQISSIRLLYVENLHLISPQGHFPSKRSISGINQKRPIHGRHQVPSWLAIVRDLSETLEAEATTFVWWFLLMVKYGTGRGLVTGCLDRYEHDEPI